MEKSAVFRKKSITVKVFTSILIISSVILVLMEIISVYNMNLYQQYTESNYENSLNLYCSYWGNRMESMRSSLANLNSATDVTYFNLCHSASGLDHEVSKVMMVKKMDQIVQDQARLLRVFTYIPDRDIYLSSSSSYKDYAEKERLDTAIRDYISNRHSGNSVAWDYMETDGHGYFIYILKIDTGYVGASMECDKILDDMAGGHDSVAKMELFDTEGVLLYAAEYPVDTSGAVHQSFRLPLPNLKYDIQLTVARRQVGGQYGIFIVMVVVIVIICMLLMLINFLMQKKMVLNPLNLLKDAMIKFSRGDMETRLPEDDSSIEISTLYSTFNEMAARITELMTEVYKKELEKQKIQSDFLKVQVQPHFYANILNLIYGLAQMKDYASIQSLSQNTAGYFRYLLGNRSTFALLREEVACVRYYMEIQKMRYRDTVQFTLDMAEGLENQLVLPMVLQTFVENSIKHNITLVSVLEVSVTVAESGGQLVLTVCDNGAGFDPEIVAKIRKRETLSRDGNKIGIINVLERMEMFYQAQASMDIQSAPGDTRITVTLPKIIEQGETYNESAYC